MNASSMSAKTAIAMALALVTLAGCTKRSVVRFEDHPKQNQTYVETVRYDNYIVFGKMTHEFWLCKDEAAQLTCEQSCDGSSDLLCPMAGNAVTFATE